MATLAKGINLSDFGSMSEVEARKRVRDLYQASVNPTFEQLQEQKSKFDFKIHFFESRYKMSSEEMKRSLASGDFSESADICTWLMLLRTRGRIEDKIRSSQTKSISFL